MRRTKPYAFTKDLTNFIRRYKEDLTDDEAAEGKTVIETKSFFGGDVIITVERIDKDAFYLERAESGCKTTGKCIVTTRKLKETFRRWYGH